MKTQYEKELGLINIGYDKDYIENLSNDSLSRLYEQEFTNE